MDTLHFEPQGFQLPQGSPPGHHEAGIEAPNLSEPEVFMLRGRRLQAQVVGGALRRALARLHRRVRGPHGSFDAPERER